MNRWVGPVLLDAARAAALVTPAMVLAAPAALAQTDIIQDIRVEGTQRIEPATVLSYLTVKPGDPFDQAQLDASLKRLFETGLFADVTLRRNENVLVVTVAENPIINRVAFEGNKKLETDKLTDEVQLKPRMVYTRTRVQADVDRILELYRRAGRYSARVEPKVVVLDQNRVDLIFEITEGPRTPVSRINFVGNHAFDGDDLRGAILTKEAIWWRFLSSNDSYDPDRLQYDKELLRRYYLANGYADFRVVSAVAELTPDRENFYITFTVDEGEKYDFGKIDLRAELKGLDPEPLKDFIKTHDGDVYNASLIEDTVVALTNAVNVQHYAFVDVRPEITKNRNTHTIDITYDVSEGPRIFVERINITGNDRTIDEVIRREMKLSEGDAFNEQRMKNSQIAVKDLDFFDKVDITNSPGSEPDKTIVNVAVTEKSTGEIQLGAGYSSYNGPLVDFSIRERNLLGEGKDLRLGAQVSSYYQQVDISYTQPYLLGRDIAAGFDLFRTVQNYQQNYTFDQTRTGFDVRTGFPLSDYLRQTITYSLIANEIQNIQSDASIYVFQEQGLRFTSMIGSAWSYDRRDQKVDTTKGYMLHLSTDLAGLGGDDKFVRAVLGGTVYFPMAEGWTLSVTGELGDVTGLGEPVRIESRFYIGGDTLRGFRIGGIGPRQSVNTPQINGITVSEDPLGGNYYARGSIETTIPLGLPVEYGIKTYGFTDFGALGGIDLSNDPVTINGKTILLSHQYVVGKGFDPRMSVGIGVSWKSPFGLVRVDIAEPFIKQRYDKSQILHFGFGTQFQ